jgi:predicted naringenin-chalcone synthase
LGNKDRVGKVEFGQTPCAIVATATVLPEHRISREDVKYYMGRVFDIPERRLEAMMSIVDNAQVHERRAIFPIEYTIEPRPLEKTNQEYIEHSIKEFVRARPERNALLIAVELPSLTFQRKDVSQANLISSVLFGDGAAAAVVCGNGHRGPRILSSETYTFPDSLEAMGFALRDSGFHILLSKDVPEMIGAKIRELVEGFLRSHGRKREEIKGWILHPGGARLLANIQAALGLSNRDTQPSWDVLANLGNLSSATILFILQEWLENHPLRADDYALAAAFGPGFSAEFLLLQWT